MDNKKGQVTIFVIVGILIVIAIAIFLLMRAEIIPTPGGENPEEDPASYLESCIEDKIREGANLISHNGGYVEPTLKREFKFEEDDDFSEISYLCYNHDNVYPCINQEPLLIQHLKSELKTYIEEDVQECWDELLDTLENDGYAVDATSQNFNIDLIPNKVVLDLKGKITLTKRDSSSTKEDFKIYFPNNLYDLAIVAQEIVSQEGTWCSFQDLGYQMIYPTFNIDIFQTGDGTKIYAVEHKISKEWFRFAVKGCTIPPAY
jgi:hypothetical protein